MISCTLGFWGYSWNTPLYINKVFMMCGPHLQGFVQHSQRGEPLWVLAALESLAHPATLLRAALCCHDRTQVLGRGGLQSFTRWRRFHRYILRTRHVILMPSNSLEIHIGWLCAVQWIQYSVHHFDWEKEGAKKAGLSALKCRSLLQIYEPISANAAQKSWLSAPPGKCWSVRHIFITLVQYHTGQLIGKSWMFCFQA